MRLSVNQKLYDKYGNEVIILQVGKEKYDALVKYVSHYNSEDSITKGTPIDKRVTFNDSDLGIQYFFYKKDIGNRHILYDPDSAYYFNIENMNQAFKNDLKKMGEHLPCGALMFGEKAKQEVIKSFFNKKENEEEEYFIKNHPSCFARMDLDTEYSVGHEVKYFDEHFHDQLYISKGSYCKIGNIQIVDWRSDIASLYYARNILQKKSGNYVNIISKERGDIISGIEYNYSLKLPTPKMGFVP